MPTPTRFSWCGPGGANCLAQASLIWQDTQAAAEQFYDRTDACSFTTFVAYEWSGQPGGNNLHRNVIFRNDVVPPIPTSYVEQPTPEGLWNTLTTECLNGLPGCDLLAIPHNPNVSGGLMFAPVNADNSPLTAAGAVFRSSMEPLVELTQHKGDSECRPGVQSTDEVCGYEKNNRLQLFSPVSDPNQTFPPLNYVRNALKEGLVQEQQIGVNPFKLGLIGSTDTHNATPGETEEQDFGDTGHIGLRDHANPAYMVQRVTPAGIEANPGGLAAVWAEENSRDAIFAAMRRREVYATSGTRPILRFFGGREGGLRCGDADFVAAAYRGGVPMGGEIGPVRRARSPRFGVLAFRDPGTPGAPGAPLQVVQIVKGWVDGTGQAQEKVFDVAGNAANGAGVDTSACAPTGAGSDSLCAVWEDPEFDASQRAFYYARVLENPTCRWSTYHCNNQGIDCSGSVPAEYAECCNAAVPKTIQERAWSSPIWYRPEGLGRLRGTLWFGDTPQRDFLQLALRLGAEPPGLDLATQDLTIALRQDAYRLPDRVSFWHVFLASHRDGDGGRPEAARLLAELRGRPADPAAAVRLGDSFPLPAHLVAQSRAQIAKLFGASFADEVMRGAPRRWLGPLASPYGTHLVWIEEQVGSAPPAFDAVRGRVLEAWHEERRARRLAEFVRALKERYPLHVESAAWRDRKGA